MHNVGEYANKLLYIFYEEKGEVWLENMSKRADERYKCQVHFECIVQVHLTK